MGPGLGGQTEPGSGVPAPHILGLFAHQPSLTPGLCECPEMMWAQGQACASRCLISITRWDALGVGPLPRSLNVNPGPQCDHCHHLWGASTLQGSTLVCLLSVSVLKYEGWAPWVSVPHTPLLPPTASVTQGGGSDKTGRASQKAGAGQAGISCAGQGCGHGESPEISEGGAAEQALASTPGTALERHQRTRNFVLHHWEETAAWSQRWAAPAPPAPEAWSS